MLTFLRTKLQPDALRRFGPLIADHSAIGEECLLCEKTFQAGDATTLVPLGPGYDDQEEREKCASGRYYNAIAILVHWSCATGLSDASVDAPGMPIQPVASLKEEGPR